MFCVSHKNQKREGGENERFVILPSWKGAHTGRVACDEPLGTYVCGSKSASQRMDIRVRMR